MAKAEVEKPKYELKILSAAEKNVNEIIKQFDGIVYDVTTTKGMETARKDRALMVKARTTVEQARKEEKADILERGKFIDSTAARLKEEILKYETPLDEKIKAEEERKEAEKQAKLLAEQERIAGINKRIDQMKNSPLVAVNKSVEEIKRAIGAITKLAIDESYQEFQQQAAEVKEEALVKLAGILEEKEAAEAEAIRIKAEQEAEAEKLRLEREELDRLRKEQEEREAAAKAENDRILAEQQAKMDAELAEQKARLDKEAAEERAKLDAERAEAEKAAHILAEEQKAIQAAKEEAERVERERLEAEKLEAEKKKAEAKVKKLQDPVQVIKMILDTANNDRMTSDSKIALIKGIAEAALVAMEKGEK